MKFIQLMTIIFILIITVVSLHTGVSLYQSDVESGIERDIYNYTSEQLNWQNHMIDISTYNTSMTDEQTSSYRMNNIAFITTNFISGLTFEYTSYMIEVGYKSEGAYNTGVLINIIKYVMYALIIFLLFIPVSLVGYGIFLLVKYFRHKIRGTIK